MASIDNDRFRMKSWERMVDHPHHGGKPLACLSRADVAAQSSSCNLLLCGHAENKENRGVADEAVSIKCDRIQMIGDATCIRVYLFATETIIRYCSFCRHSALRRNLMYVEGYYKVEGGFDR